MLHLKLTIMALLWAGGFIAAKQITYQAGPFTISFLRFFVVTMVLGVIVAKREKFVKLNWSQFATVLIAAFLGEFCYNYFFFSGIKYIDASRGSVIISLVPIVIAVVSYSLFREKISVRRVLGIILSIVGAWVVISKGQVGAIINGTIGQGELFLMACTVCAAVFTLLSRQLLRQLSPTLTMFYISVFGTAFLFVPALIEMNQIPVQYASRSFLLNLLYLSVGPSVIAVAIYYDAIKKVGPTRASQYMNLIPVFAVVLAFVFLGEQLSASLIVGGSFVTTGLWLANLTT